LKFKKPEILRRYIECTRSDINAATRAKAVVYTRLMYALKDSNW